MEWPNDEQIAVWHASLFRTALRMTGRAEDAADLTQLAFSKALNAWDQFEAHAKPIAWLYRILINCVRDWHRKRAATSPQRLSEGTIVAADPPETAVEKAIRREQLECLRREIRGLPGGIREAFIITVLDGYSYEEAAELLAVPVGTIGSRVYQARRRLREAMRKSFPEA